MLSIVSSYIVDSMDETMKVYYQSEEYLNRQEAINSKLSAFDYSGAPEPVNPIFRATLSAWQSHSE